MKGLKELLERLAGATEAGRGDDPKKYDAHIEVVDAGLLSLIDEQTRGAARLKELMREQDKLLEFLSAKKTLLFHALEAAYPETAARGEHKGYRTFEGKEYYVVWSCPEHPPVTTAPAPGETLH